MTLIITQLPQEILKHIFLCVNNKDHYSLRVVAKIFYNSEALHERLLTHAFPKDISYGRFHFHIPNPAPPSWAELYRNRVLAKHNLLNGLSRIDNSRTPPDDVYFFTSTRKNYVLSFNDLCCMPLKFVFARDYLDLPDVHYGDFEGLPIVKLTCGTETILLRFDFKPTFTDKCYKITKIALYKICRFFIEHHNKIMFFIMVTSGAALVFLNKTAKSIPLKT